VASGQLAQPGGRLDALASSAGITVAQLSIAWLLRRSPVMIPIPGTSKVAHVEENCAASGVVLDDATYEAVASLTA
jgi:aryl-alcohol dehydrogenase-like predicted oxidoreductase